MLAKVLKRVFAVLLAAQGSWALAADEVFNTDEGAIRGYDAVAYQRDGKAVKGEAGIALEWNGATWRFASAANRDAFRAAPERYAPQYGGYCAYGTANGYKVGTDPNAFSVVGGRLYLNYSAAVQKTWLGDRDRFIQTADGNWKSLEHSVYERPAAAGKTQDAPGTH